MPRRCPAITPIQRKSPPHANPCKIKVASAECPPGAREVEQTTVKATRNHAAASSGILPGEVVDDDRTVELATGEDAIAVVVTSNDGETTPTHTVNVTGAEPQPPTAGAAGRHTNADQK